MAERHVLENAIFVAFMHHGGVSEATAAFGILGLHQVAFAGMSAQHLAAGGDFETLGRRFLGFNAFWTSHKINQFFSKEREI